MSKFTKLLLVIFPYLGVSIGLLVFSDALLAVSLYFLSMLIIVLIKKDKNILSTIFSKWKWKEGLLLSIVCGLSGFFLIFIWSYIQKSGTNSAEVLQKFNINSLTIIIFGIYLMIINPVIEEIFWRHILNTDSNFDFVFDAFFAGYHIIVLFFFVNIIGLVLAFIALFSISVVWREVKSRYNGLIIPIVSHAIADISVMVFMYSIYSA